MINVDELLKPISDDKPCGEDFTYHPSFQNLETIARPKPGAQAFDGSTEDRPAEEPQWKEVLKEATEVLSQSKHLGAGVILAVASLKMGGLEGLRDGFAVVRGLTDKYWADVYPRLDPEDNNDPTERLNILNNLSSAGEPYRFTVHLKQVVLCDQPMARITLQQILNAKERVKSASSDEAKPSGADLDLSQIQAAFRDAGPEAAAATLALVNEVIGHAQAIETFLDSILASGRGVNFETLHKLLGEMRSAVEPFSSNGAAGEVESGEPAPSEQGGGVPRPASRTAPAIAGTIQSTADVLKTLDLICQYYKTNEPSSPVPLILQRAQRLVAKDFMEILTDLTPDALSQLQVITGAKPKE
jgi:type VI secretion system protein ImpA